MPPSCVIAWPEGPVAVETDSIRGAAVQAAVPRGLDRRGGRMGFSLPQGGVSVVSSCSDTSHGATVRHQSTPTPHSSFRERPTS